MINTDNGTMQNQLGLVDKKIIRSKNIGLLWTVIGVVWLMMSILTLTTDTVDAIKIFQLGLGIIYFISGLLYLKQVAELEKKKVILEVIMFINQANVTSGTT